MTSPTFEEGERLARIEGYGEVEVNPQHDWDVGNDLNAVREAELKCIEEFGEFEYGTALLEYLDEGGLHYNPNLDNKHAARLALLPAEIRAQAVCDVLEVQGK